MNEFIKILEKENKLPIHDIELLNQIIFAVVSSGSTHYEIIDGVHYFPSELQLREFRLFRKDVIWLQELVDKKCSKCYGKGKIGINTHQTDYNPLLIKLEFVSFLGKDDKQLAKNILAMLRMPENFLMHLQNYIKVARSELRADNLEFVSEKYTREIIKDFVITEMVWCNKCFIPNFCKAVEEKITQIKFMVN